MRNKLIHVAILILSLFLFFLELQCKNSADVKSSIREYSGLDSKTNYVGMGQCKKCHQNIYDTFLRTGMGLSIDHASREKSAATFDKHALVYDKDNDFYYQPLWKDDSLHILEYRLSGNDTVYQRIETVSYIIGSGQHTNSHIYNVNGYLYQAPLTFYTQRGTWDLPPGFENGNNSRFSRIIGLECLSCHDAYPQIVPGSENKYTAVPNGIDCERCHGPGSQHVADKQSGKIVDITTEIDYSIVNPSKLPIDLQLDVCQRCHIQGNAVLREGKSFYDFKPGMRLSEVMDVFMPVYSGRKEEHIMASHAERLKQSKCFINTVSRISANEQLNLSLRPYKDALTCITCHNPHVSRLEIPKESFNNACKGCHNDKKESECSEKVSILSKNNFNCVICHMPENKTVDIPHVKVHDHRIMIPVSEAERKQIKTFVGIVAINNPDPGNRAIAKAYINYYEKFNYDISLLDSALLYINKNTNSEINENIRLLVNVYFLKKEYLKVNGYINQCKDILTKLDKQTFDNEDAWTCYRIAESCYNIGDLNKAILFYKQSYKLAPSDPKFGNEYAEHLAMAGRTEEAKSIFETIIKMQPDFAPSYCNLGFIYLSKLNNISRANQLNEAALSLDPDYEAALMNKAAILLIQRKNAEAKIVLIKVLRINPLNSKANLALKQISSS